MDPALILGPYGAIVCLIIAVIYLHRRNERLERKIDESNEASRDLIRIQARMLEGQGVQVIPVSKEGR